MLENFFKLNDIIISEFCPILLKRFLFPWFSSKLEMERIIQMKSILIRSLLPQFVGSLSYFCLKFI